MYKIMLLLLLFGPVAVAAQTRVLSASVTQQAMVLRHGEALVVLQRDQVNAELQLQLVRVHDTGADLRFLGLPEGELLVRVERGSRLDLLREQLQQRPIEPATISVPIPLDPATGLPLRHPPPREPAAPPPTSNKQLEPDRNPQS